MIFIRILKYVVKENLLNTLSKNHYDYFMGWLIGGNYTLRSLITIKFFTIYITRTINLNYIIKLFDRFPVFLSTLSFRKR